MIHELPTAQGTTFSGELGLVCVLPDDIDKACLSVSSTRGRHSLVGVHTGLQGHAYRRRRRRDERLRRRLGRGHGLDGVRFHIVILLVLGAASGTGLGEPMGVVLDHDRVGHDGQIRVPEETDHSLEDDSKSERNKALVHELDRKPHRRAVLPRA